MRAALFALAVLPIAFPTNAVSVTKPSDAARAMSDCGKTVRGPMARRTLALNKILATVDRDCAREVESLAPFENENIIVRKGLLLRYLDLGADPRQELPPSWTGTGVRIIY